MKDLKAECTWGEGPDVLLVIKKDSLLMKDIENKDKCRHGTCSYIQVDLSADEAIDFANEIISAANCAKKIEISYEGYFNKKINSEIL